MVGGMPADKKHTDQGSWKPCEHSFRLSELAEPISFESGGRTLRGWFVPSPKAGPQPVIVMAHGWTATKEMWLDRYAQAFNDAGFACLLYDHPFLGESEGEPRREIDPEAQIRGYQDAITYVYQRREVDADAIGIWGTSYAGGHVLVVSAADSRVRCVVAQCPTISGWRNTLARFPGEKLAQIKAQFAEDRVRRAQGDEPARVAVSPDLEIFQVDPCRIHFGNNGTAWILAMDEERRRGWGNDVTLRSLEFYSRYEPGIYVAKMSSVPLLMVLAENDTVTPFQDALEALKTKDGIKSSVILPGGHYDLYVEHFEPSSAAAVDWFSQYLLGARPRMRRIGP